MFSWTNHETNGANCNTGNRLLTKASITKEKAYHLSRCENQSCSLWFSYPHNNSSKTLQDDVRGPLSIKE